MSGRYWCIGVLVAVFVVGRGALMMADGVACWRHRRLVDGDY